MKEKNNEQGYKISPDIDFIIEERGNTLVRLAEVSWFDNKPKLELRKWIVTPDGEFNPNKGVTFSTEEGPSELVHCLLRMGYGDNMQIKKIMEERGIDDIDVKTPSDEQSSNVYFDPSELVG